MEADWSNKLVIEFINLYEKYPEIWDLKNVKHKDKLEVHDCWHKIQDELSIYYSIDSLKKKKESLMSTYRALKKKVKDSMKSGAGRDDIYTPTWFAYQHLDIFLGRVTSSNNKTINTEDDTTMFTNEMGTVERENSQERNVPNAAYNTTSTPKSFMRKSNTNSLDKELTKHMELASSALENLTRRRSNQQIQVDECSLYGELLASKLRALSLRTRKILTNKIDNIVFEAELNEIDSNSSNSSNTNLDLQYPQTPYNQNMKNFSKPSTSNATSTKSSLSHSVSNSFPYRISPDNINSSLPSKQIITIPKSSTQLRNFPIDRQSSFKNNQTLSNQSSPHSLTNQHSSTISPQTINFPASSSNSHTTNSRSSPLQQNNRISDRSSVSSLHSSISPQTIYFPASNLHSHITDSRQTKQQNNKTHLQQNNKTSSNLSLSRSLPNSVISYKINPVTYSALPSTQVIHIPVSNPHNTNIQSSFQTIPSNPEVSPNMSPEGYTYSPLPSPQFLFEEMNDDSQSGIYESSSHKKNDPTKL